MNTCKDLEEVRQEIDEIDYELIALIARRGFYVQQAAKFKLSAGSKIKIIVMER